MAWPGLLSTYTFSNRSETQAWGRALGAHLIAGDVISLVGDLGAGKTTLTQSIARGMGISASVTSPTFALAQEYPGGVPLFHFDPYRLDSVEAFAELGFEEYLERGGAIGVEWGDKIESLLPEERLTLTLSAPAEASGSETAHADSSVPGGGAVGDPDDAPRLLTASAVGNRYVALLSHLNGLFAGAARHGMNR